MDKKTIIGLMLIFAILMGYSFWSKPSKEEQAQIEKEHKEAAIAAQKTVDSLAQIQASNVSTAISTDSLTQAPADQMNVFSDALTGENKNILIENDVFKIKFQTLGGRVASVELKDFLTWEKKPLVLFAADKSTFNLSFNSLNLRHINTKDLYFEPILGENADHQKVSGKDSLTVKMRVYPKWNEVVDKTRYIEFLYTVYGDQYMVDFKMNFEGMQDLILNKADFIDFNWTDELSQLEKSKKLESQNTAVYYKPTNDKVDYLKETSDDAKEINTPVQWVGFKQQFFSMFIISDGAPFMNTDVKNYTSKIGSPDYLKSMEATLGLPYQNKANQCIDFSMYFGPNKYKTLREYHHDLERVIPLGWSFFLMQWINRYAVLVVFNLLEQWHINYGIIILILTVLLKIVLLPIAYKSYLSQAKMRIIKPEVDELSKKFPKPEQALEKQKAVMSLYKKAGINQMAGCIPMLLQFPILIAMFRFFPASIELRQQPFLWADDLSSYDSILTLPFNIPFYGDHVSLFALLMAITNLAYTHISMKQQATTMPMPGMKFMMYFMPIMFLGLLNSYASGLNYYYVLSTCFTLLQTWVIKQLIDESKVHAKIQENKKKPVKKSKWQARMEEMMKQQQMQQRKK